VRRFGALAPLLALLLVAPVSARTWHVPAEHATIGEGLAAATAGDTVLVACGDYAETDLVMVDGVVLRSETGAVDCVTVDALWLGRGLMCDDLGPGTAIEGFTFTHGVAAAAGAVFCNHATVTFRDCAFVDNYAGLDGAGFYCNESAPLLERCLFADNVADAGSGGGFCSRRADPVLLSCVFRNNRAGGWGGGFYASGSDNTPVLDKCVFAGNVSANGGAVACKGTETTLSDCELLDNMANEDGGGFYLDIGALALLANVRFEGNSAANGKAGMVSGSSAAVLRCCDLDVTTVNGSGDITYETDGCDVPVAQSSWGAVKRIYR
jgi:predicted outer membrane repeat protein